MWFTFRCQKVLRYSRKSCRTICGIVLPAHLSDGARREALDSVGGLFHESGYWRVSQLDYNRPQGFGTRSDDGEEKRNHLGGLAAIVGDVH